MSYRKILLRGDNFREEAVAYADITPGHLIELKSDGTVQKQSVEGADCESAFALEAPLNAGASIDTPYGATDIVFFCIARPGDIVYAYIAQGETISVGERLTAAGNGCLQSVDAMGSGVTANKVIGVALEAVTTTSAAARIPVRML